MNEHFKGLMLISDLDGTYLNDDSKALPANIAAVNYFLENGGLFTIATGRTESSVQRLIDSGELVMNAPAIIYNGCLVYDFAKGVTIAEKFLDNSALPLIKAARDAFPSVGIEVYNNRKIYILNENRYTKRHARVEMLLSASDCFEKVPVPWNKVIFLDDTGLLPHVLELLKTFDTSRYELVYSASDFLEILPRGVTKGTALEALCENTGIKMQNVFAAGDFHNDMDLIVKAGTGAAVAGALDELKEVADIVLCSNNDGAIAEYVEYIESLISRQK